MLTTRDIINLLHQHVDQDEAYFYRHSDYWHYGWRGTSERVAAVAELAVAEFPGDLVEIGCAQGLTTERLAKLAAEHGRKVIAVDPWERAPDDFQEFSNRIEPYRDSVIILPMKSQRPEVRQRLGETELCFAWVDGEHNYPALLSDLQAVAHAGVIAVDDILWDWQLLRAFHEIGEETGRARIRHPWCNEGYIV